MWLKLAPIYLNQLYFPNFVISKDIFVYKYKTVEDTNLGLVSFE